MNRLSYFDTHCQNALAVELEIGFIDQNSGIGSAFDEPKQIARFGDGAAGIVGIGEGDQACTRRDARDDLVNRKRKIFMHWQSDDLRAGCLDINGVHAERGDDKNCLIFFAQIGFAD